DGAPLPFGDLDRREPDDITRCDAEELASLEPPQPGAAVVDVGAPLQRLPRGIHELAVAVLARELDVVPQRLDEAGLVEETVAEHAARPEEPARALGRAGGVAERAGQHRRARRALRE